MGRLIKDSRKKQIPLSGEEIFEILDTDGIIYETTLTDMFTDLSSGGSSFEIKNDIGTSILGFGTVGNENYLSLKTSFADVLFSPVNATSIGLGTSSTHSITGAFNTLLGIDSGTGITGFSGNTYIGFSTGINGSGNDNVYLGSFTGSGTRTGSNCIFIGVKAGTYSPGTNDHGRLIMNSYGNSNDSNNAIIYGKMFNNSPTSQELAFNAGIIDMKYLPTYDPSVVGRLYISAGQLLISAGGGGACITGDALISLISTETISFKDLNSSMKILTYNKSTKQNEVHEFNEVITKEHTDLVKITLIDRTLKCTNSHPWQSDNGWVSLSPNGSLSHYNIKADLLAIGTKLLTKEGDYIEVLKIEQFKEQQITYHIKGVENNNYYANGILTAAMQ